MSTTLSERLKIAMAGPPKVTGVALAKACKIAPPSVSDWLSGKSKSMDATHCHAAARHLGVSSEWLATGLGLMRPAHSHRVEEPYAAWATPDWPFKLVKQDRYDQLKPEEKYQAQVRMQDEIDKLLAQRPAAKLKRA